MKTVARFLFALLMVWQDTSFAEEDCTEFLLGKTHLKLSPFTAPQEQHQISRVAKVIESMNKGLFSQVKQPKEIYFRCHDLTGAGFYVEDWCLTSFADERGIEHPEILDAHEYSHAIFYHTMIERSPEWRAWHDKIQEFHRQHQAGIFALQAESVRLHRHQRELSEKLLLEDSFLDALKANGSRLAEVELQLDKVDGLRPPLPRDFRFSQAYQELFADLSAILFSGNQEQYVAALTDVSDFFNMKLVQDSSVDAYIRQRAFLASAEIKGWDAVVERNIFSADHNLLNPTRWFIAQNYLIRLDLKAHPAGFLRRVLDVLISEILEKRKILPSPELTPEKQNQDLIERLKKEFDKK